MNKNQEIYDYFWKIYEETHGGMLFRHYLDELYELIEEHKKIKDKEKSKNVILYTSEITNSEEAYSFYTCPECRHYVDGENYCPNCGQRLDWSD